MFQWHKFNIVIWAQFTRRETHPNFLSSCRNAKFFGDQILQLFKGDIFLKTEQYLHKKQRIKNTEMS